MEDLNKYTPIELNKMILDTKTSHDSLKEEVINETREIDEITIRINKKLADIDGLEKLYIALIEELNKR
jgi:hypothetical protein